MKTEGTQLSIPEYMQAWNVDSIYKPEPKGVTTTLSWSSDTPGDILTVPFNGKRIGVIGRSDTKSGYARIRIKDKEGNILHDSLVDFYSKIEDEGPRFVSKTYPEDEYVLEVEVTGENPVWFNKRGDRFGSTGFFINVEKTIVD